MEPMRVLLVGLRVPELHDAIAELDLGMGKAIGNHVETLAEKRDLEFHSRRLYDLQRFKKLFRILVVFPTVVPQDKRRPVVDLFARFRRAGCAPAPGV